jgi:hypothetical protein
VGSSPKLCRRILFRDVDLANYSSDTKRAKLKAFEEQLTRLNLGLQPIPHTQGTQPDATNSLGVGFAMARTVIMRHQGHLVVESELGRGTTVIVRLPISLSE